MALLCNKYLLVSPDRDTAYIGAPTQQNCTVMAAAPAPVPFLRWKVERGCDLHGYPVHLRCWILMERRVRRLSANQRAGNDNNGNGQLKLELLVKALKERWAKFMANRDKYRIVDRHYDVFGRSIGRIFGSRWREGSWLSARS